MYNPRRVRPRQALGYLHSIVDSLFHWHRPALDLCLEHLALVEGHRDEELMRLRLADLIDGADIGMVESRSSFRFLDEALLDLVVEAQVRRQKLQRHRAVKLQVAGLVDHAHAPAAELLFNLVVGDSLANHGVPPSAA